MGKCLFVLFGKSNKLNFSKILLKGQVKGTDYKIEVIEYDFLNIIWTSK